MLDAIKSFVARRMTPKAPEVPRGASSGLSPIQLAAAALLLELAHADEEFSEAERTHIQNALARHFALDVETTSELIRLAEAERGQSIDHFQFTRLINESYDEGQKMVLAEVMWGVILADGKIAEHESYLVQKMAYLLRLQPGYLNRARRAAASRDAKAPGGGRPGGPSAPGGGPGAPGGDPGAPGGGAGAGQGDSSAGAGGSTPDPGDPPENEATGGGIP